MAQTESLFLHCVLQGPPACNLRLHSSLSLPSSAVRELKAEKKFEIPVTVGLELLLRFCEAIGNFLTLPGKMSLLITHAS